MRAFREADPPTKFLREQIDCVQFALCPIGGLEMFEQVEDIQICECFFVAIVHEIGRAKPRDGNHIVLEVKEPLRKIGDSMDANLACIATLAIGW